jgi:hypothetical protein
VSSDAIEIQSRADGTFVPATLLGGMAATDLLVVENEWRSERSQIMQQLLAAGVPRVQWPQSLHWDWSKKASMLQLLETQGFGIVCEQRWQGVILTKASPVYVARLGADKGKQLVYVDFLEIAPWNWAVPEIGHPGRYRTVGSTLFWRAVKLSEEEGFHGRVGLHALRQAEWFYEKACGMTPVGRDANKQNLLYFELPREDAQRLLQKGEQT